jgi:hypothetical protein
MLLRISDNIGMPIASVTNPDRYGTGGLYIRLSATDAGSRASARSQEPTTYLLTNRHVICGDTETQDIGVPSSGDSGVNDGSKEAGTLQIDMIQLSPHGFSEISSQIDEQISSTMEFIDDLDNHEGGDYRVAANTLGRLQEIQRCCSAHKEPSDRRIGTVEFSPRIGKHATGYRRDWALVRCANQGINVSCMYGLNHADQMQLVQKLRPGFAVSVEGRPMSPGFRARFDFIKLEGFFTRNTIKQYHTVHTNPKKHGNYVRGTLVASDSETDVAEHKKQKLVVYKYGAVTDSTCGMLNCISSRQAEDGTGGTYFKYCIIGFHDQKLSAFSEKGDSGSAIFGLLPVPLSPSSPGASKVAKRGGKSGANHTYTPGIIGLLWGGIGRGPVQDVTYATPIEDVLDNIKKHTGRDIVNLQRLP